MENNQEIKKEEKRKPIYSQKRFLMGIGTNIALLSSFFTTEEQTLRIVELILLVITTIGYLFQEAWVDRANADFKNILKNLNIIKGGQNEIKR